MKRHTMVWSMVVVVGWFAGCDSTDRGGADIEDDIGSPSDTGDVIDARTDTGGGGGGDAAADTRDAEGDDDGADGTGDVADADTRVADADTRPAADTRPDVDTATRDVTDVPDTVSRDTTIPSDAGDVRTDGGDARADGGDAGATPVTRRWTELFGTRSSDRGFDLAVDGSGNIFVAGETHGGLGGRTNSGFNDAFVAKYDGSGARQWVRLIGTSLGDRAMGVTADGAGAVYVVGHIEGDLAGHTNAGNHDAFVAKYDTGGTRQWVEFLATSQQERGRSVASDGAGHIYVAGYTRGDLGGETNQSGSGAMAGDAYLAKYDTSGTRSWVRLYGTAADDYGFAVATGGSGEVYLAGETEGDPDGQTNSGGQDGFVAKYDASGNRDWSRLFGTSADDKITAITADSSGRVYGAGHTEGQLSGRTNTGRFDSFAIAYDGSGQRAWMNAIGSPDWDFGYDVSVDASGDVWMVGSTGGDLGGHTNAGGYDGFLARFDAGGNRKRLTLVGTSSGDEMYGVATDGAGGVYTTGGTHGDLDGGTNNGGADVFVSNYE